MHLERGEHLPSPHGLNVLHVLYARHARSQRLYLTSYASIGLSEGLFQAA